MEIPTWALNHIHKEKVDSIIDAIKIAEKKTSGEIIPMVVKQSTSFGHVSVIVATSLMVLILMLNLFNPILNTSDYYYVWYIIDLVIIAVATLVFARLPAVKRLLTTNADQEYQVGMRAEVEFFEAGMRRTRDATGILLFVSLLERRAVVLADKAISEKLPDSTWEEVCQILIEGSRQRNMEKAFVDAITKCGDLLAPHFPRKADDQNEIKDQLILKE